MISSPFLILLAFFYEIGSFSEQFLTDNCCSYQVGENNISRNRITKADYSDLKILHPMNLKRTE
jgi:hypothetical protein